MLLEPGAAAETMAELRRMVRMPLDPGDGGHGGIIDRPPLPGYEPAMPPGIDARAGIVVEAWKRAFARPPRRTTTLLAPETDVQHRARSDLPFASNSGAEARGGSSRWGTSANWSGAVVTARDGARFTSVAARWRVPVPKLPPGASEKVAPPGRGQAYAASIWIGLDGHRPGAPSLPQIGTTVGISFDQGPPRIESYAWAQWWVRGRPGREFGEVRFTRLAITPGDSVSCWLSMPNRTEVFFRILNETTGEDAVSFWTHQPMLAFDALHERRDNPVSGQAASWVVERPAVADATELYPLVDFGAVTFESCWAASRTGDERAPLVRDLTARRMLRMTAPDAARRRIGILSAPDPGGSPDSVTVRYRG